MTTICREILSYLPADRMKIFWILLGFLCGFLTGAAADTCWVYDYKHHTSSVPYKRVFTCPCGCCGSNWSRECCPSLPLCHHNNTFLEHQEEDTNQDDEIRNQALILSGIVVGTFMALVLLTFAVHLCGRVFLKPKPAAPSVVVYNIHGKPDDFHPRQGSSMETMTSGNHGDPPPYKVTTEL